MLRKNVGKKKLGQKKLVKIAKKIRWKNVGKREKLEKKCWEMGFEKH